ncbi:MAG: hypothetical protein U5K76_04190 [Woeseiaceae bacterium]|nr:hypothetical protein [Woeseiaceae bacterium]
MRILTETELAAVAGGTGVCTEQSSGNTYGGRLNPAILGDDFINFYEGAVRVVSHVH